MARGAWLVMLLALFTLSHGYLTLVYAAPLLRTTLVALFLVGVLGSLARTTLSHTRHFGRAPCMLLAMTLLTYVPMIALRALTLLLPFGVEKFAAGPDIVGV